MSLGLLGELIVGGIKVKDGLFIGDQYAAQDAEFILVNKITHVINCAAREVPNFFEAQGVEYLSIPWEESDQQILFDQQGHTLNAVVGFIDRAQSRGESVLVHSLRGQSRASCAICAYFMWRFRWGFYKTLEFLDARRPDLEIRRNFFEQLKFLAERIVATGPVSDRWDQTMAVGDDCIKEEIVLKNTFLNSRRDESAMLDNNWANKKGKVALKIGAKKKKSSGASNQGGSVSPAPQKKKSKGLRWADEGNKPKSLITDFYGPIYKGQKLYREGMASAKTILKPDSRGQDGVDNSSAQGGTTPPRAKPRRLLQTEEDTAKHLPSNMITTPTGPRSNIGNSSQSQSGSYVNGQLLRPSNSAKRLESGLKKNPDSSSGPGQGYSSAGQRAGSEKRRPNSSQNSNGPTPQNEIAALGPQTSLLSGLPPRTGNLISNTSNGKPPTGKNLGSTIKKPQESSIRKDNLSGTQQQHQFFPSYTTQSSNFHDGPPGMAAAYGYHSQKANPTALDSPQVQDLRDSNEFSNSVNQGSAKKRPASTGSSTTQTHQRILKDEDKNEKNTANNSKNR